jgi:hypothetical protein
MSRRKGVVELCMLKYDELSLQQLHRCLFIQYCLHRVNSQCRGSECLQC